MTIKSYQEVIRRTGNDETLLYVEPALARKFFVDRVSSHVREKIGESLLRERFLVKACWGLEYLCLLALLVASVVALQWYCALAIPVMIAGFIVLNGEASMGKPRIGDALILTLVGLFAAYYLRDREISLVVWCILVPLPYLFTRLTYKLATSFLHSLTVSNERAFTLLYGNRIIFKEELNSNEH